MSNEKFTKGPWQVVFAAGFDAEIGVGMDSYLEDETDFYTNHLWTCEIQSEDADEECLANAALIAAAPEMYELLQKLRAHYNFSEYCETEIDALLAKARGE